MKLKKMKILVAVMSLLTIGCEDVETGGGVEALYLPEQSNHLNLAYRSGFTMAEDFLKGNVEVDVAGLSVEFKMKKGTDPECNDTFAITTAQATELQELVSDIIYFTQDPDPAVSIADGDLLSLEIDQDETYEIRVPGDDEEGHFTDPEATCEVRALLNQWVVDSGLATDCSALVVDQLFYANGCEPIALP